MKDSTSTTTKSVIQNYERDPLYPKTEAIQPNFNNGYSYDKPITRTPQVKVDWEEKFRPVKVTPLHETKLETDLKIKSKPKKPDDIFLLEDIAPKSSISLNLKENPSKNVEKNNIKNVDLPKWPYVENLWNKVDQIVVDLLEPEDSEDNQISNSGIKSELFNSAPSLATNTEKDNPVRPVAEPDQAYWQNLKEKYGFISAHTEQYPDRTSTTVTTATTTDLPERPLFYHASVGSLVPRLPDIILETQLQTVASAPQVIQTSNQISFDSKKQPASEPYGGHPSILVAKRNISSSDDVLGYLNHLMKKTNQGQKQKGNEPSIRETTARNFFKPDLLPSDTETEIFPIPSQFDQIQDSLGMKH